MAMFVGGVQVTGTQTLDATKLTGNMPALNAASLTALSAANVTANGTLPALNGSNLTSLPSPSAVPVVNHGTVGSYACLRQASASGITGPGQTQSGSLQYSSFGPHGAGAASGTWKLHGGVYNGNMGGEAYRSSAWQRIS